MAKVSIGLRGWRFDESDVFTDAGEFRPLEAVPDDARRRLIRLSYLQEKPCDACYLIHGEAEKRRCNESEIVYGEPMEEVLLCADHEADFLYWFREAGGSALRGEEAFRDEFHEWFASGGRAPGGYGGLDHVDTDPDRLPTPPDPAELNRRLNENAGEPRKRIDLRTGEITYDDGTGADGADTDADGDAPGDSTDGDDADADTADAADELGDLDLGQDYPTE